jgi:hypothetical protein
MAKKQNDNPMPLSVYTAMARWHPSITSGVQQVSDLHHALVDKGDVRGMPLSERKKIHDARNLWWVSHSDHASHANILSKQEYYRLLCEIWGTDAVDEFVMSFNWKNKAPFTLEWLKEKGDL